MPKLWIAAGLNDFYTIGHPWNMRPEPLIFQPDASIMGLLSRAKDVNISAWKPPKQAIPPALLNPRAA